MRWSALEYGFAAGEFVGDRWESVGDKLVDDSEIADDAIGFHAQQAVEKLLKAVLANRRVEYPSVHDIDRLVDLLEAHLLFASRRQLPGKATQRLSRRNR